MGIFQRLTETPIFQGMSNDDLSHVVSYVKFDFYRTAAGETIVADGERCSQLIMISTGDCAAESKSDDHGYSLTEYFHAPILVQPERLFGRLPYYTRTVRAVSDVNVIALPKGELLSLCADFLVVRLNLFNILSTSVQKLGSLPWHSHPSSLDEEFVAFVAHRCLYPAGRKELIIKMERLANELDTTRLRVSQMLRRLKEKEFVDYARGRIVIHSLEKIIIR